MSQPVSEFSAQTNMPQQATRSIGDEVVDNIAGGAKRLYNRGKALLGVSDDDEDDQKKKPAAPQGGGADAGMVNEANQTFMARAMAERKAKEQAAKQAPPAPKNNLAAARNRYGKTAAK